jgi:hypothetical protein
MRALIVVAIFLLAGMAHAQDAANAPSANPLANGDFLAYHPDLGNRKEGLAAYERKSYATAAKFFRKAARYADKPSQAMLAEMLWKGMGETVDRAQAYAWMDLAAERGYPSLIAVRENYWSQLDDDERKRAVDVGQAIYAEYGDAVAKPRLAMELRRGQSQVTGSHVGLVGDLAIKVPGPGGDLISIPSEQYYAPRYWDERQYWAWQDALWKAPSHGAVHIGSLEPLHSDKRPAGADPVRDDGESSGDKNGKGEH